MLRSKWAENSQGSNPISPCSTHAKKKPSSGLFEELTLEMTGSKITGWKRRNRGFKQRWKSLAHTQYIIQMGQNVSVTTSHHRQMREWQIIYYIYPMTTDWVKLWSCNLSAGLGYMSRAFPSGQTKKWEHCLLKLKLTAAYINCTHSVLFLLSVMSFNICNDQQVQPHDTCSSFLEPFLTHSACFPRTHTIHTCTHTF